ncbi:MAG: hypothetical protein LKG42_03340 [Eubacterium sp.]|jgi:hypothetical protein|nr:hypothetical protein [Eubacterium sp.]MCH4078692.1 hypothetical protein [Eubacterium sp.]MCH4109833.1 hypothetical protein [Eubacterium sp.]MCI1307041.1 hypothetical protein [Eubacterium sp.]
MNGITSLLEKTGIPFAYDHFAEGDSPAPPFLCWMTSQSDPFSADGSTYLKISEIHLELYTDRKDLASEKMIEDALDDNDIFYSKSEVWIETEQLFEVLYIFEMEDQAIWETKSNII